MTCAVFLSPYNLFTLMALYILCAVFCLPCWPFLFCARYFVCPFYLTQLYLFTLLALSISCTVFCSPCWPFLCHVQYFIHPFYTTFVHPGVILQKNTTLHSPFLAFTCQPCSVVPHQYALSLEPPPPSIISCLSGTCHWTLQYK